MTEPLDRGVTELAHWSADTCPYCTYQKLPLPCEVSMHERLMEERRAQGLGPFITDPVILDKIAAIIRTARRGLT